MFFEFAICLGEILGFIQYGNETQYENEGNNMSVYVRNSYTSLMYTNSKSTVLYVGITVSITKLFL